MSGYVPINDLDCYLSLELMSFQATFIMLTAFRTHDFEKALDKIDRLEKKLDCFATTGVLREF